MASGLGDFMAVARWRFMNRIEDMDDETTFKKFEKHSQKESFV
jgi:hypothetical protein